MDSVRCRAFVNSVKAGSFAAAARAMGYTPSAIGQLVHALEEDMGFPLLRRNQKGVVLTSEGEMMLKAAEEVIAKEDAMYQLAAEVNGFYTGTVSIAAFNSLAAHVLPDLIKSFNEKYPGITIRLVESMKGQIGRWIEKGRADIAFVSDLGRSDYHWTPFMRDRIVAVIPKDHPLADAKTFPMERFAEEPTIIGSMGNDMDVNDVFAKHGVEPNVTYTTLENYTAMNMVERGLGISMMNEFITKNWQCDVRILPIEPEEYIEMGMVLPSVKDASPSVQRFYHFAEEYLTKTENK